MMTEKQVDGETCVRSIGSREIDVHHRADYYGLHDRQWSTIFARSSFSRCRPVRGAGIWWRCSRLIRRGRRLAGDSRRGGGGHPGDVIKWRYFVDGVSRHAGPCVWRHRGWFRRHRRENRQRKIAQVCESGAQNDNCNMSPNTRIYTHDYQEAKLSLG